MALRSLFDIQNRVVAVAGAAGGLGSAIVAELASRGCHLSLFDKNAEGLEALTSELPSVHSQVFDATKESDCESVFDACVDRWGRIDGFINCVGDFAVIEATDMPVEVFSHILETNVTSALSMCRHAVKHMIPNRYGRIINIASVSDSVANPGYAAYAASKSALTHLTRVMAVEWAQYSITANAISPALCETNLTRSFLAQGNNLEYAKSKIRMNRLLEPEDILGAVILLLSPGGSFITGQAIHVDGGRTIA